MKTISYYDLLNMVKNNEYPSVYYNYSNRAKTLYVPDFDDVDNSFLCYILKNNKEYNEEYARHYLVENILESEMFENNLEIIEDTPKEDTSKEDKKIENVNRGCIVGDNLRNIDWHILNKLDEIIDKINGDSNE